MAKLKFEIVTAERVVHSDEVDVVIAPGLEGELAILPYHTPLFTMLHVGELRVRKEGEETAIFVSGGFLEVRPDKVVVLADVAERAEEIDVGEAEKAKQRAEEALKGAPAQADLAGAEAAMRCSLMRLKVAERRRRRQGGVPPP